MHSRYEILNEVYSKTVHIEAVTLHDMMVQQIIPAASSYASFLAQAINSKKSAVPALQCRSEISTLERVSELTDVLSEKVALLQSLIDKSAMHSGAELSHFVRACIVPAMEDVRSVSDELELLVGKDYWPVPTYADILFYV